MTKTNLPLIFGMSTAVGVRRILSTEDDPSFGVGVFYGLVSVGSGLLVHSMLKGESPLEGTPERNFLGLVATHKRKIRDGKEYDALFPKAEGKGKIVLSDGNVRETVRLMGDIVVKYADDTKKISELLKGDTLRETCRNIWTWCYNHLQYKLDKDGVEQLRRPARSWADRHKGIDCDCFSIFVGSILHNLQIPFRFRVTKYAAGWQHVYVIVPDGKGHLTLDCVLDRFNTEQPFTDNFDHKMDKHFLSGIPIEFLSGLSGEQDSQLQDVLSGGCLCGIEDEPSEAERLAKLKKYLMTTRDYIRENPQSVLMSGGAKNNLQMLDYAIKHWDTPQRDAALDILESAENKLSTGDESVNGIGKISVKKFFGNVKDAVKTVTSNIKEGVKDVASAVVKYNPVSLAARGGFLLGMKINIFHMAQKLYPAYLSESEAKNKGVSSADWSAAKRALASVEKMFVDKLKGSAEHLKNAITEGRASKRYDSLKGLGDLGDPATIAAIAAAAAPLVAAAKAMDDAGVKDEEKIGFAAKAGGFFKKVGSGVRSLFNKDKSDGSRASSEGGEPAASDEGSAPPSSPGEGAEPDTIFKKIGRFAKENPVKATLAVAATAAVVTLAVSPKARKMVGLGGVKVYRKGKRYRPRKGYIPKGKKIKTVTLK